MLSVRVESVEGPFRTRPRSAVAATRLLCRVAYLGVLEPKLATGPLTSTRLQEALHALLDKGVGATLILGLDWQDPFSGTDEEVARMLQFVSDHVEESPLPESEWKPVREALGDELLEPLLDVSEASLRRYAAGARTTPDDVAARLHVVAMIVADLAGGYNERGMRRWFVRPRAQLDGRPPLEVLRGGFDPDGPEARRVRDLAAWLVGAGSAA